MTVRIHDDGGTANGGVDTSADQTFTITITAVNDEPTLNAIADGSVNEDAAEQTVALAGIGTGAANESQTLTVTASSSNTALIPESNCRLHEPECERLAEVHTGRRSARDGHDHGHRY